MAKKKGFSMTVKTVLPPETKVRSILGVDAGGDVQKFVTNEIFRRIKSYMPKKTGKLRESATVKGSRHIVVNSPYAKKQFFGVRKDGTPYDYNTAIGGAKAGNHWDRRLVADEGKAIVAEANRYVRSRKRGK